MDTEEQAGAIDDAVPISARGSGEREDLAERSLQISHELLGEAIGRGLEPGSIEISRHHLSGGMTALEVAELAAIVRVIFKMDWSTTLVEEARTLRRMAGDDRVDPNGFQSRFPRVLALRDSEPPYAYLMESFSRADGYRSLDEILFGNRMLGGEPISAGDAERLVEQAMAPLFASYSKSADGRFRPNVYQDYFARIAGRMRTYAAGEPRVQSRSLHINGIDYAPWHAYFERLEALRDRIERLGPSFVCAVHGDPHAENVLVRKTGDEVEIRFIDPKPWGHGDWLFDIAKMTVYLDLRGSIERLAWAAELMRAEEAGDTLIIEHRIHRPSWAQRSVQGLKGKSAAFALAQGDKDWEVRYRLAEISNILGIPAVMLERGKRDPAMLYFVEGIIRLHQFIEHIEGAVDSL